MNDGSPGSNGLLAVTSDLYGWLRDPVVATLFQDAVCGDGICQTPEEQPGVGRFGWYSPSPPETPRSDQGNTPDI